MVIVERAIVVGVRIECASIEEADAAFADLGTRIRFSYLATVNEEEHV